MKSDDVHLSHHMVCSAWLQENGKNQLQQMQDDVEEVKVIMLDNLQKADERKEKMGNLEDRAEELLEQVRTYVKKRVFLSRNLLCVLCVRRANILPVTTLK